LLSTAPLACHQLTDIESLAVIGSSEYASMEHILMVITYFITTKGKSSKCLKSDIDYQTGRSILNTDIRIL
jgi:hypothetical protein